MTDETAQPEQPPEKKPRKVFKRPNEILALLARDVQHIAEGRNILKRRFGMTDAEIDFGMRQTGLAPLAASVLASKYAPNPLNSLRVAKRRTVLNTPRKGAIF